MCVAAVVVVDQTTELGSSSYKQQEALTSFPCRLQTHKRPSLDTSSVLTRVHKVMTVVELSPRPNVFDNDTRHSRSSGDNWKERMKTPCEMSSLFAHSTTKKQ